MYKNLKLTIGDAKLIKSLLKLFKACGFQRQRLWSPSADGETLQRSALCGGEFKISLNDCF